MAKQKFINRKKLNGCNYIQNLCYIFHAVLFFVFGFICSLLFIQQELYVRSKIRKCTTLILITFFFVFKSNAKHFIYLPTIWYWHFVINLMGCEPIQENCIKLCLYTGNDFRCDENLQFYIQLKSKSKSQVNGEWHAILMILYKIRIDANIFMHYKHVKVSSIPILKLDIMLLTLSFPSLALLSVS